MFDVPPPDDGVRGIDAYRATWPPFFEWQRPGRRLRDRRRSTSPPVPTSPFAHALLRCGTPDELAAIPDHRLRLTLGLRKDDGRWIVTHEHHSFPFEVTNWTRAVTRPTI